MATVLNKPLNLRGLSVCALITVF